MKKVKKPAHLIALLLACTLLLTLTACSQGGSKTNSSGSAGKPYQIVYAYNVWLMQTDTPKVQDAVNKLLRKKINAEVKLMPMTSATYSQQMNLMISSGEKLDLFNEGNSTFGADVADNKLMALNDNGMLDKYAAGAVQAEGKYIKACTVNGKIYGLATIRDMAQGRGIYIRDDLVKKYNIDLSKIKTANDLDGLFATLKKNEPNMYPTQPQQNSWSVFDSLFTSFDNLGDSMGVLMNFGQDTKVTNIFETDYYKQCIEKAREWYEKGYIMPDCATNTDTGVAMYKAGKVACTMTLLHPLVASDNESMSGIKTDVAYIEPPLSNTYVVTGVVQSIPVTCKNPQKVLQFLNLCYTDKDVFNTLVYGVEGVHYVHAPNSSVWITYPKGVTAQNSGYNLQACYLFGNRYLAYIWDRDPEDLNDQYHKFNDGAYISKAMGFLFDPTPVKSEVAALTTVMQQYRLGLENGSLDPNVYLPKFQKALKDGGIDKVIAEKQKQLNAWLAAQS